MVGINTEKKDKKKIICPICKSENTIKWTKRQTQNRGISRGINVKIVVRLLSLMTDSLE